MPPAGTGPTRRETIAERSGLQQALGSKTKLAYTTVQTMLNLLYRKKR